MSQEPTQTDLVQWAIDNGASGAFVAVLATDAPHGGRHHARRQAARAARHGATADVAADGTADGPPAPWGSHLTALWRGELLTAWRTADGHRRRTMRAAGAVPASARDEPSAEEVNPAT